MRCDEPLAAPNDAFLCTHCIFAWYVVDDDSFRFRSGFDEQRCQMAMRMLFDGPRCIDGLGCVFTARALYGSSRRGADFDAFVDGGRFVRNALRRPCGDVVVRSLEHVL